MEKQNKFDFVQGDDDLRVNPKTGSTNPFDFVAGGGSDDLLTTKTGDNQLMYPKTQYDEGYLTSFGSLDKYKAEQQKWYDELANQSVKTGLGIGLDIIENTGYLGELAFGGSKKDYSNFLTEIAKAGKEGLDEALPLYKKDPNDITSFDDSAWWIEHGGGLVQSISSFLVTGAVVGKGLGSTAKYITQASRQGKFGTNAGQALAQLGTASTLTYTEGAMEGADVYKQVLEETGDVNRASEAAAHTVKLNMLNVGLNLTSLNPLFKTSKGLAGITKPTGKQYLKSLGLEGVQEGLEEDVNLWAREEGKIKGGIAEARGTAFDRFIDNALSEEGGLSFALGFVGGVGQRVGMGRLLKREYEDLSNTIKEEQYRALPEEEKSLYKPVANKQGEREWALPVIKKAALDDIDYILKDREATAKIADFKQDVNTLTALQAELASEVSKGNKEKVQTLQQQLFDIGTARSIKNGMGEELAQEVEKIGTVDNTEVNEQGVTKAMQLGLTESPQDNSYKQKASKSANDIRNLSKEYEDMTYMVQDPYSLDRLFNLRLATHTSQNNLERTNKEYAEALTKYKDTVVNPTTLPAVEMQAKKIAFETAKKELERYKEVVKEAKKISPSKKADELEKIEKEIQRLIKAETLNNNEQTAILSVDPEYRQSIKDNAGVIKNLSEPLTASFVHQAFNNKNKTTYNKALNNLTAFEEESREILQKEVVNKLKNLQEIQKEEKVSAKETTDIAVAKEKREKEKVVKAETKTVEDEAPTEVGTSNYETFPTQEEELTKEKQTAISTAVDNDKANLSNNNNNFNTIRYVSQEKNSEDKDAERLSPINSRYKVNHSTAIGVNTPVVLRVDTESSYYKEGDDASKVPIGVFIFGRTTPIGYVALRAADPTEDTKLKALREFIVTNEPVNTTISKKTNGVLAKTKSKRLSKDIFKSDTTFAIGYNNVLFVDKNVPLNYTQDGGVVYDGYVHALVKSPTGRNYSIPIDTNRVSDEIATSMAEAIVLFLKRDKLTPQEQLIQEQISDKANLTSMTGVRAYVEQFIFLDKGVRNSNLKGSKIIQYNESKKDKYYVDVTPTGISYIKSGEAVFKDGVYKANEIGVNSPLTPESEEQYKAILKKVFKDKFMRMDVSRIASNAVLDSVLLKREAGNLTYSKYTKNMQDYMLENTSTNLVGHDLDNGEKTYWVHPTIEVDTSFLYKQTEVLEKNINQNLPKPVEKVIITQDKPKVSIATLFEGIDGNSSTEITIANSVNVSPEDAKALKDKCT